MLLPDAHPEAPVIVAYGGGVDSTAAVIGMVERGMRIDHILFADTGSEKPETIEYVSYFSDWLASKGYPSVTTVRYRPKHDRYTSLGGACISNKVMPSLAYGGKSCSQKFKVEVQHAYILGAKRGLWKGPGLACHSKAKDEGLRTIRVIGYDAGPKDARRSEIASDAHFDYVYPLREWGWDRIRCMMEIIRAGLRVPIKSACFFCPASKPLELLWLHAIHPDLFMQALEIEELARPRFTTVEGMWRKSTKNKPGSWVAWAFDNDLVRRTDGGELRLVPHAGPAPRHPDEDDMREASERLAA